MTNVKVKPSPIETITKILNKEPVIIPKVEFNDVLANHLQSYGKLLRVKRTTEIVITDEFYRMGLRAKDFGDVGINETDLNRMAVRDLIISYMLKGYGSVSYIDGVDSEGKAIAHVVPAIEIYFKERSTLPYDAKGVHKDLHSDLTKGYHYLKKRIQEFEDKDTISTATDEIGKDLVEALRAVIKATNLLVETTTGYSGMMDDISKLQHLNILKHIKDPKVELEKTKGNKIK